MEKKLLNYSFYYVCDIEPARNIDRTIKEFYPAKKYSEEIELNKYGNGPFCRFSIPVKWVGIMGVYVLFFNGELKYIGQCIDFGKRYNQGYGKISSENCKRKGQSTNCKINNFILNTAKNSEKIKLYFFETNLYDEVESALIDFYKPILNHKKGKNISKETAKKNKSLNKVEDNTNTMTKPFGVKDAYNHLNNLLEIARKNQLEYLEIVSGTIHKELNLKSRMPTVCDAMYKLKKEKDEIIYSPPKGRGSTLRIKYFI